MKGKPNRNFNLPSFYASTLGEIRKVAKKCGYAITIHGSMCRDFDLCAIPWIEEAVEPDDLIEKIRAKLEAFVGVNGSYTEKPHGRKAYVICLDSGKKPKAYLDISVMPKI